MSLLQSEPLFFVVACISSLLFLCSFLLLLLGGHDGQGNGSIGMDAGDGTVLDSSADAHHIDSTASFKMFTMQSLLAFFMGFGWVGLACRLEWNLGYFLSTSFACLFGASLLLFTAYLMSQVYRLNAIGQRDLYQTLGDSAKVYLTIPEKGKGKIQVVVDGSLKTLDAVSKSERIEQFREVEIVGVEDQSTLIVRAK